MKGCIMLKLTKYLILCFILILFIPFEVLSKTCCHRNVGTEILFPYDVNSQIYNDLMGAPPGTAPGWNEVFTDKLHGGGPLLNCPEIYTIEMDPVKPVPFASVLEYKFSGRYSVTGDREQPRGYTVTLSVDLIDIAHGATVKNGQARWTCGPVGKEAGYCLRETLQNTQNLAKTFQPVDKLIYDYERIPESLDIELGKDSILVGDEMTITLKNIKDANSKPSQPWQRILVKAEKGKILNGLSLAEYRVFEVESGNIKIQYQAPEACGNDKITIMNSCYINPNLKALPGKEIATRAIKINCPDLTAEYDFSFESKHEYMSEGSSDRMEAKSTDEFKAKVKASYSLIHAVKWGDKVTESYRMVSSNLQEISGLHKVLLHSRQYREGKLEREYKCQGAGLLSGGKIHQHGKVLHITYDAKTSNVRKVEVEDYNFRFNLTGKCPCEEHYYRESWVRQYDVKCYLLAPALRYIKDHSGGYYIILGFTNLAPEFQKASGNREGGVISGGGNKFLEIPNGLQIMRLNYQFKKIKR